MVDTPAAAQTLDMNQIIEIRVNGEKHEIDFNKPFLLRVANGELKIKYIGEEAILAYPNASEVRELPVIASTDGIIHLNTEKLDEKEIEFYHPGLRGVTIEKSQLTWIDGRGVSNAEGKARLQHLGVDISEWAVERGNEYATRHTALAASMINSALYLQHNKGNKKDERFSYGVASDDEIAQFNKELATATLLSDKLQTKLRNTLRDYEGEKDIDPMSVLKELTAKLDSFDRLPLKTADQQRYAAVRSMAVMPILMSMVAKVMKGDKIDDFKFPAEADLGADFNYVRNLAVMLELPTDAETLDVLDKFLLVHLDHEMNASTLAAKGVQSADVRHWDVLGNHIGALHGVRHGYANVDAMQLQQSLLAFTPEEMRQIADPEKIFKTDKAEVARRIAEQGKLTPEQINDRVDTYIEVFNAAKAAAKAEGKPFAFRIPGFGHAVYEKPDPREAIISQFHEKRLAGNYEDQGYLVARTLISKINADPKYVKLGIAQNVDSVSGSALTSIGIDSRILTLFFEVGRTPGASAQVIENADRVLARPGQISTVQHDLSYPQQKLAAEARQAKIAGGAEALAQAVEDGTLPPESGLKSATIAQFVQEYRKEFARAELAA